MKKLLFIFLLIPLLGIGQDLKIPIKPRESSPRDTLIFDHKTGQYIDKVCFERGHIIDKTKEVFQSNHKRFVQIIDYKDSTILIVTPKVYYYYTCVRCNQFVSELEPRLEIKVWDSKKGPIPYNFIIYPIKK